MRLTRTFQCDVECRDAELVVEGAHGMVIERLASVFSNRFVREAVGIRRTSVRLLQIKIGDAMDIAGFEEQKKRTLFGALVIPVWGPASPQFCEIVGR